MKFTLEFGGGKKRQGPAQGPVSAPPNMLRASTDGQFESFQPAQRQKSPGILARIQRLYWQEKGSPNARTTTEQGASSAASPLTYPQSLLMQRYDRRASVADCRELVLSEPRARVATRMYAYEAVRGGVTNKVEGTDALSKKAQEIWDSHTKKLFVGRKGNKLYPWAWGLVVEGDLFTQMVCAPDDEMPYGYRLVGCKRMPTVGMERLTDDADEFTNPLRAFEQIDAVSNEVIATWPEALMCHTKWDAFDGDRYGTSELIASRRQARILMLQENSQTVRRMTRAPQRKLWNIGNMDNPSSEQDVNNFKATNGWVEGGQEIYDPVGAAMDYFSNGMASCQVLEGDKTVHEVDDLRYTQDVYAASLPTPSALYNLNAGDINRDVLTDLHMRFLQGTKRCNESLEEVISFIYELDLILHGVDPNLIVYMLSWTKSTIETVGETVGWINESLETGSVSVETAVKLMQEFTGVQVTDEEVKLIMKGMAERAKIEAKAKPAPAPGKKVAGDSRATNGHGRRTREYSAADLDESEVEDLVA